MKAAPVQQQHFPTPEELVEMAKRVEPFVPGKIITVPLAAWPAYRQMYGLTSTRYANEKLYVKRGGDRGRETEAAEA